MKLGLWIILGLKLSKKIRDCQHFPGAFNVCPNQSHLRSRERNAGFLNRKSGPRLEGKEIDFQGKSKENNNG